MGKSRKSCGFAKILGNNISKQLMSFSLLMVGTAVPGKGLPR